VGVWAASFFRREKDAPVHFAAQNDTSSSEEDVCFAFGQKCVTD
jgi:hypothetical protein